MKNVFLKFVLVSVVLLVAFGMNMANTTINVTQMFLPTHLSSNADIDGGFDVEEWIDHTKKDINSDGSINAIDLSEMKKIILGKVTYNDLVGDTNDNGTVDIVDLVYLKKYISKN